MKVPKLSKETCQTQVLFATIASGLRSYLRCKHDFFRHFLSRGSGDKSVQSCLVKLKCYLKQLPLTYLCFRSDYLVDNFLLAEILVERVCLV